MSTQPSIIVVDGFYPDPEKVRAKALKLAFERSKAESDYGFNGLLARSSPRIKRDIMARLRSLVGVDIEYELKLNGDFKSLTQTQFKAKKSVVHYDLWDWSGVINLSPPKSVRGYTTFWTHRKMELAGFHDLERTSAVCQRLGCRLADLADMVDRDSAKLRCWEETSRIEHAFNRLILFRGNMFHSASPGFGRDVATSKLSQTFFFDVKE